ncbi:MAG: DUF4912 domain-containing protein [Clostridia bacterium]|nr:DUF4912 domain-containing protein [Clostridia bacterium]
MPTKESKSKKVEKVEKEPAKAVKKLSTTTSKKKTTAVKKTAEAKSSTAKSKSVAKKEPVKKATTTAKKTAKKEPVKKAPTTKKETKSTKSTTKKATSKKTVSKEEKPKKATRTTKKTTSTTKKTAKVETEKKIQILEYYDLPYRYNETTIKILAQTPNILFVYWDISDNDRANYTLDHGEYFFNDTYPVLIVHNVTKNYSTEVPINDFANSWYLHLEDANCEYKIELGRRYKEYAYRNPDINIPQDNYIHVKDSNDLVMPNDHVLFETIKSDMEYRNVKNGQSFKKNISEIYINDSLYTVKEIYEKLYQIDNITPFFFDLSNPGSGNPTSTFK